MARGPLDISAWLKAANALSEAGRKLGSAVGEAADGIAGGIDSIFPPEPPQMPRNPGIPVLAPDEDLSAWFARLALEATELSEALAPAAPVTADELARVICPVSWENVSAYRKDVRSAEAVLATYHVTRKADR